MAHTTEEYPTGNPEEKTRNGLRFVHFYVLLALVVVLAGATGYLLVQLRQADADVRQELGDNSTRLTSAIDQHQKSLQAQLVELDATLGDTRKELNRLANDLGKVRSELADLSAALDKRILALSAKDDELAAAIKTEAEGLAQKVEVVKAEFAEDQAAVKTVVSQIQDDSKYIVSELGKKAEKAYLRFMERKLKKKISAVSEKVDTVKVDLEGQIVATQTKIQEMAGTVGEEIKKSVEEHVKIDFVPSEMDEE